MLLFLRLTLFLLTLPCLTALATIDPSDPGIASIQSKLSAFPAKLRVAQAEPNGAHGELRNGKSDTAGLEDVRRASKYRSQTWFAAMTAMIRSRQHSVLPLFDLPPHRLTQAASRWS